MLGNQRVLREEFSTTIGLVSLPVYLHISIRNLHCGRKMKPHVPLQSLTRDGDNAAVNQGK